MKRKPDPTEPPPGSFSPKDAPPADIPHVFKYGDADDRPLLEWLIRDLIARTGIVTMAGPGTVGKTAGVLDACACCITGPGTLFANRFEIEKRCAVLILQAETPEQARLRLEGTVRNKVKTWYHAQGLEMPELPLYWVEEVPDINTDPGRKRLKELIAWVAKRARNEHGLELGLVVVDTVTAACDFDQDNTQQVGRVWRGWRDHAAAPFKLAVVLIDHFGKAGRAAGIKGNKGKEDNSDTVLYADHRNGRDDPSKELWVEKMRFAPAQYGIGYTLQTVQLDLDEKGRPITSVVVHWEGSTAKRAEGHDRARGNGYARHTPGANSEEVERMRIAINAAVAECGQHRQTSAGERNTALESQVRDVFWKKRPPGETEAQTQRHYREVWKRKQAENVIAFERVEGHSEALLWLVHQTRP